MADALQGPLCTALATQQSRKALLVSTRCLFDAILKDQVECRTCKVNFASALIARGRQSIANTSSSFNGYQEPLILMVGSKMAVRWGTVMHDGNFG